MIMFLTLSTLMHGKLKVAEFLISKGANVNALDSDGKTPLDFAIRRSKEVSAGDEADKEVNVSEERCKKIETLLSKHGAKANLRLVSHKNGYCAFAVDERPVTEAPFIINNTVTSSSPLSLPSALHSAISGNSRSFSDTIVPESQFGMIALGLLSFLGVFLGVGVMSKSKAPAKQRCVQPDVEKGLLDEQLNLNEQILKEGEKKFGPGSLLNDPNISEVESMLSL